MESEPQWPIMKYFRGQNILPVTTELKRGLTFNRGNHEDGSTIGGFLNFWVQTEIIWRNGNDKQFGQNFYFQVVMYPQIIALRFF